MEVRILGPVRIHLGGREDTVGGSKQRTMLAALLLAEGRSVSDAQMVQSLWGEDPPATASAQIHTYASRIRQRVDPEVRLDRIRNGYQISAEHVDLDYRRFRHLVDLGRRALAGREHAEAALLLRTALGLWRGDAVADTTRHLISMEQPYLEEQRVEALELRLEAELVLGLQRELIPELRRLVARYPLRERLRALLMTALYRAERQADAIALFQDCRRVLDEELGVAPGRVLSRTYEGVLTGEASSLMP